MPTSERAEDRGIRRGRALARSLSDDLRAARVEHGLNQRSVARAVGISDSQLSRIELGETRAISIERLAAIAAVVGLELAVRAYPTGRPIRDAAHAALILRFRRVCHPRFGWRTEVPMPLPRDLRAWDVVLVVGDVRIGIEAETRVRDIQSLERRTALKLRDSGFERAILVLADTRSNRRVVRETAPLLAASFPVSSAVAVRALRAGSIPEANAVVFI